ncbi:Na(+)-translocating NADH-quinone reductase subunit F [Sediminicola sp. 1XM1-17]|uniref:Na(+)-translocating NADH-quinone reductase subunit F n=1 Tax=Sediminicola sp. 1XM1-17 TaxID=3127702 RepID=UPI0030776AED
MKELTRQELHNLAMNIVGKHLEAAGYEFVAINSTLGKNPQFVCTKEKQLSFVVVRNIPYPEDPREYDEGLMRKIKAHAKKSNAQVYYAGVGLVNAKEYKLPVYLNEEYIVDYDGLIAIE